ncbi:hypothetical protein A3C86_04160 [Candidatus Kaiserbacteria bacterium RIFCSPHIGHO2_02_FULL_49_16]|uniref:ABC transporter domain-containing protein n=1 Tax=Candidatus Kaiserbacteria bacterium RIFCSPHIGHO2_02_FULL_49_16 TaxID=1798490 RepID=A0A1F6DI20_9BACT|nr:MAG: hypothetical protein A3C86_04160 [Candidatus Kaiserbacteria bacterium RIFCSPHIGHO2_02_FULL_49_16]
MQKSKPFISLENVLIRLREKVLFKDLNWEILANQHWAVIGPNGSGKSALLKALAGTLPVAKGNITHHFLGNENRNSAQDQIAFVAFGTGRRGLSGEVFYQERWNVGLNEDAPSVSDLLSAQGIRHTNRFVIAKARQDAGFPARRRKVIRQLGLKSLLERKLFQLSNGERRKLGIARALLQNPRLLILDNPFEGLDESFRARLARNLKSLMRSKMRIIIAGTNRDLIPSGITNVLRIKNDGTISQGFLQEMGVFGIGNRGKLPTSMRANSRSGKESRILVQMKNVSVSYNKIPVLRGINWTVRENEKWALLGPNGAGKTTLLSLIIGDNPQAYANDITIFGKRRGSGESIWDIKQKIGWVAPELQIYYPTGASCIDVVCSGWFDSIGLYKKCNSRQRKIALAWIKSFGLSLRARKPFEEISEGEQRLALLARALVKSPRLLVLDEPCQGLDVKNRDRVLKAIDSIEKHHKASLIFVTHRKDEIPKSITNVFRL